MLREFGSSMFACHLAMGLAILVLGLPSAFAETTRAQKPGLLILNHGSPAPSWNKALTELTEKVAALNAEKKTFHAVATAMLEFSPMDAAAGIEALESAGCDKIIVVPIFVGPNSHSLFDVPAVLGLYSSPATRKALAEENIRSAAPRVPVTVTQTMSEGDLLDWYVAREVLTLSQNPKEEAVLLIAHGSEDHGAIIDKIMSRLLVRACGSSGITAGQVAYCKVGQTYQQNVIPAICELSEQKKRVLIIGVYLATSAKTLHERAAARTDTSPTQSAANPHVHDHAHDHAHEHEHHHHGHDFTCLEGMDVRFSEKGVIDHPKTPEWILQTGSDAL